MDICVCKKKQNYLTLFSSLICLYKPPKWFSSPHWWPNLVSVHPEHLVNNECDSTQKMFQTLARFMPFLFLFTFPLCNPSVLSFTSGSCHHISADAHNHELLCKEGISSVGWGGQCNDGKVLVWFFFYTLVAECYATLTKGLLLLQDIRRQSTEKF